MKITNRKLSRRQFLKFSAAASAGAMVYYSGARLPSAQGLKTVRVGYIPIQDSIPLFLGLEKGYFKEQGLDIKHTPMAGGAVILPAVASGAIDIGLGNYVSVILGRQQNFKFSVIAAGVFCRSAPPDWVAMVVKKDSPIKSAKDLAGKRISTNTLRNINDLITSDYLSKNGVNPKGVTWVEVPFPHQLGALENNQIAAAALPEPFVTIGLQKGLIRVLDYCWYKVKAGLPVAGVSAYENWIVKNEETVEKFVRAYGKAVMDINSDPNEARRIVPTFSKITPKLAKDIVISEFRSTISVKELQFIADLCYKYEFIPKKADVSEYIYKTALPKS
jgi:NitT/TauT family transport system substrate-binding protein